MGMYPSQSMYPNQNTGSRRQPLLLEAPPVVGPPPPPMMAGGYGGYDIIDADPLGRGMMGGMGGPGMGIMNTGYHGALPSPPPAPFPPLGMGRLGGYPPPMLPGDGYGGRRRDASDEGYGGGGYGSGGSRPRAGMPRGMNVGLRSGARYVDGTAPRGYHR